MRRAWSIVLCFLIILGIPPGADAAVKPGACLVTITMTFDPPVTKTTTDLATVGLSGSGNPCAPVPSTNVPNGLFTSVSLTNASGGASVVACGGIVGDGNSYELAFAGHYGNSNGVWRFAGSTSAGVLALIDSGSPGLVGIAGLALDPQHAGNGPQLQACAIGTGMTSLQFVGVITFAATP